MRNITEQFPVFSYEELPPVSKQKAFKYWQDHAAYESSWMYDGEFQTALKKFEQVFNLHVTYEVDPSYFRYNFQSTEDYTPFQNGAQNSVRISKYVSNKAYPKGENIFSEDYAEECFYSTIERIYQFKEFFGSYKIFIDSILYRFFNSWQKDMEYHISEEYFSEIQDGTEYFQDGSVYIPKAS